MSKLAFPCGTKASSVMLAPSTIMTVVNTSVANLLARRLAAWLSVHCSSELTNEEKAEASNLARSRSSTRADMFAWTVTCTGV